MRSTFLNLKGTIGFNKPLPASKLEFRELDYAKHYGINDLSAESIWELAHRLATDENLHKDYLVRKLGMDPEDPDEVELATEILLHKGIVVAVFDKISGKESISTWP